MAINFNRDHVFFLASQFPSIAIRREPRPARVSTFVLQYYQTASICRRSSVFHLHPHRSLLSELLTAVGYRFPMYAENVLLSRLWFYAFRSALECSVFFFLDLRSKLFKIHLINSQKYFTFSMTSGKGFAWRFLSLTVWLGWWILSRLLYFLRVVIALSLMVYYRA